MGLLATNDCLGLLNNLLALGQDQLNVARVRHVRVDLCFHELPTPPEENKTIGMLTRP